MIAVTNLSRRFGSKLALDRLSLEVQPGCVFGLVGENGAGKSTLIKHILGLLRAETGTVRVFGLDPVADPSARIRTLSMVVTWRFLVSGLWIGLSGNGTLFTASAISHAFMPFVGIIGIAVMLRRYESLPGWIDDNLNFLLVFLTLGIIAKLSLWVFSWRDVAPEVVQQYFIFWTGSTLGLIGLGVSLWRAGRLLLVLVAILIVPLARIGLAPSALIKNRHR